jgi:hypothetical protein
MGKYLDLKKRHSDEMNAFPMAFAFNNKQFEEAKEKLGVTDTSELLSIPGGGMIRKTDSDSFTEMWLRINKEADESMLDDEYLLEGFIYELGNHEFGYTGDPEDTLATFCLTMDEVRADERLNRIFGEALKVFGRKYIL